MNLEFTAFLVHSLTLLSTHGKAQSDCTRELWIECEKECGQTCDYPFRRPTIGCLRRCIACLCFPGFVRDKDSLNCISVFSCPSCPYNEKYEKCESECSSTCQTPLPPSDAPCTTPCTNCTCKEGFLRDEYSGRCVQFDKCPKCPPYEEFVECARYCQPTCDNPITDSMAKCRLDCATCVCKEGYIREMAGGRCIPTSRCISKCPQNERHVECESLCQPTCKNPNPDPNTVCPAGCATCICEKGFIRDENTEKCVIRENCSKCPRYEVFVNCYSPCERTCQNPSPDPSIPCATGCTNCTCPFAHLRDEISKNIERLTKYNQEWWWSN